MSILVQYIKFIIDYNLLIIIDNLYKIIIKKICPFFFMPKSNKGFFLVFIKHNVSIIGHKLPISLVSCQHILYY